MCARRFLAAIFILTLLVVAGSFAIYKWGGNVLLSQATPQGHFDAVKAGDAPDYAKLNSWISHPAILTPGEPIQDVADDPARWQPEGEVPHDLKFGAPTFFVHPTTYLGRDRWNAPLVPGGETEARTRMFVRSQASSFYGAGEIWAPRYRQAAFGAFLLKSEDARKALDLAYADVRSAFDEFLKAHPKDLPIILAGHSQGALHLSRLLVDRKAQLKGRLVAAFVIGWPLSTSADLPAMGIEPCRTARQTGCVLSWQSFAEPANPSMILEAWEGTKGSTGFERRRQNMLCVNPITGTQDGSAAAADNPGTLIPTSDFRTASLRPGLVGAKCEDGLLLIDAAIPSFGPYVLPGNNYHVYDYALFWNAVGLDATRRLRAWLDR